MYNTTTNGFIVDLEEVYDTEVHQRGRKKEDVLCKEDLLNFVKDVLFDYLHSVPHFELIENRIKVEQYGDYVKGNEGCYVFYFTIQFRHPVTTFSDTITFSLNDIENIKKDDINIPKAVTKIFKHYIKLMKIFNKAKPLIKKPRKSLKGIKLTEEHKNKIAKSHQKPIVQLDKNGSVIKKWSSAHQASNELGIYSTNITQCCKGKYKSAGGFKWMYAKDYKPIN